MNGADAFGNHIAYQSCFKGLSGRQPDYLAVGRIRWMRVLLRQGIVDKPDGRQALMDMMLHSADVQLGKAFVGPHVDAGEPPHFIELPVCGQPSEMLKPVDGEAGIVWTQAECGAVHTSVFANGGGPRITNDVRVVREATAVQAGAMGIKSKARACRLIPSRVSTPATRETSEASGRHLKITNSPR